MKPTIPFLIGNKKARQAKILNDALHTKWLWEARTSVRVPWTLCKLNVSKEAQSIFRASNSVSFRNGVSTLFWQDPWINGSGSIMQMPP
jgi:hypothetical protein